MQYGLLKFDILKQINIVLKGYSSFVYRKNGNDYDILVKINIVLVEDLKNLQIKLSFGENKVLLLEVVFIDLNLQLDQIKYYKKDKIVIIYSDVKVGCNFVKMEDELNQEISKMDLNGVNVIYDGEKY